MPEYRIVSYNEKSVEDCDIIYFYEWLIDNSYHMSDDITDRPANMQWGKKSTSDENEFFIIYPSHLTSWIEDPCFLFLLFGRMYWTYFSKYIFLFLSFHLFKNKYFVISYLTKIYLLISLNGHSYHAATE